MMKAFLPFAVLLAASQLVWAQTAEIPSQPAARLAPLMVSLKAKRELISSLLDRSSLGLS